MIRPAYESLADSMRKVRESGAQLIGDEVV